LADGESDRHHRIVANVRTITRPVAAVRFGDARPQFDERRSIA